VGKIIPPMAFIPAAERYNLMATIDKWIITKVFSIIRETKTSINFSINLSGSSLTHESTEQHIRKESERFNIKPSQICFEITETAAIANIANAVALVNNLTADGYAFSLDDFGSGLSSFGYLKNFKVRYLKIDGAFIKHIDVDETDLAFVKAIIQIGHTLNIKTVAEYAESESIYNKLREIEADYVQGYYIGKPSPVLDVIGAVDSGSGI